MQVRVFLRAEWAVLLDTSSLPLPFQNSLLHGSPEQDGGKIFTLGEGEEDEEEDAESEEEEGRVVQLLGSRRPLQPSPCVTETGGVA